MRLLAVFLFFTGCAAEPGCRPDPCANAAPMCIEAGPPEALRAFVVGCIGGPAPDDEADDRVANCMEAGYALHCTRRARVTGSKYFTASGPRYSKICPDAVPADVHKRTRQ